MSPVVSSSPESTRPPKGSRSIVAARRVSPLDRSAGSVADFERPTKARRMLLGASRSTSASRETSSRRPPVGRIDTLSRALRETALFRRSMKPSMVLTWVPGIGRRGKVLRDQRTVAMGRRGTRHRWIDEWIGDALQDRRLRGGLRRPHCGDLCDGRDDGLAAAPVTTSCHSAGRNPSRPSITRGSRATSSSTTPSAGDSPRRARPPGLGTLTCR